MPLAGGNATQDGPPTGLTGPDVRGRPRSNWSGGRRSNERYEREIYLEGDVMDGMSHGVKNDATDVIPREGVKDVVHVRFHVVVRDGHRPHLCLWRMVRSCPLTERRLADATTARSCP
jgi:hypothetical protein